MAEKKISAKSEPRSRRRGGPETDSLVQILLNSYKGSDAGLPPELETLKEELQGFCIVLLAKTNRIGPLLTKKAYR